MVIRFYTPVLEVRCDDWSTAAGDAIMGFMRQIISLFLAMAVFLIAGCQGVGPAATAERAHLNSKSLKLYSDR